MKRKVAKIIGFMALVFLIGAGLIGVMRFRYVDGIQPMEQFYKEKPDTIDVILVGSSHVFMNVSPKTLWEEYGIASYDLAGSVQPLWNSYFYIKEALKSQTPRLFILDVHTSTFGKDYIDHSRIIKNTFGLSFSEDRIEAIKVSAPPSQWISYELSYPNYHQRYADISKSDYYPQFIVKGGQNDKMQLYSKGHALSTLTKSFPTPKIQSPSKNTLHLSEKNKNYLKKIIDLCKEHQIPLLLIKTPFAAYSASHAAYYAEVEKIAKENDIPFVNFNHYYKEIGIDFAQDVVDSSHLNHRGSAKFSRYLGLYLKEHYDLPDHRGDPDYASYDTMCRVLQWKIDNQSTVDAKELQSFLDQLIAQKERYLLTVGVQGNYQKLLKNESLCQKLKTLGVSIDKAHKNDVWVIDAGEERFHAGTQDKVDWHMLMHDGFVSLRRPALDKPIECNISREAETFVPNGLSIVVYDKEMEYIVNRAGFVFEKDKPKAKQELKKSLT